MKGKPKFSKLEQIRALRENQMKKVPKVRAPKVQRKTMPRGR